MGSPKKQRKKFSKPSHPWQRERILAEHDLVKEYGLNRKYELWKMGSILKNFTHQAKNLVTAKNAQVEKEKNQLLAKLSSLGLMGNNAKIEDVLSLTLKDVMERRLQTLVYRKSIANSIRQARQFIVHEHISLGDKTVTAPSYLVPLAEENIIHFAQKSPFNNPENPTIAAIKAGKTGKGAKGKEGTKKEAPAEEKAAEKPKEEKKDTAKIPSAHDSKKQKEGAGKPKKKGKEDKKEVKEAKKE